MITKINKIRGLGLVFADYAWDNTLPAFKRFNLIYGWNGSGKTSLSRLFDVIRDQSAGNAEYEIADDGGITYRHDQPFGTAIRVFNSDYVRNNVQVIESRANAISILLGAENKALTEQIQSDKRLLDGDPTDPTTPGKRRVRDEKVRTKSKSVTLREGKFTDIAKAIGAAIGGSALRDYRKPQAEKDFQLLTEKAELDQDALERCSLAVRQESLPSIPSVVINRITLGNESTESVDFGPAVISINSKAKLLLQRTVESVLLDRLAQNPDIATWVETGLHLHKKYKSTVCEYCSQEIPSSRLHQLALHFNEADTRLKEEADGLISDLQAIQVQTATLTVPDKARFYTNLQADAEKQSLVVAAARDMLSKSIVELVQQLSAKKTKTTEVLNPTLSADPDRFVSATNGIAQLVATHNKTTADFDQIRQGAIQKLKRHYLSTIYDEVVALDASIKALQEELDVLETDISTLHNQVVANTAKISSKHKACELLNDKLATFLGHKELQFVATTEPVGTDAENVTGYRIVRGTVPAVQLSEGEKTAIAFVHFVVHLSDQGFSVGDGIIVVDDPISSLDSGSLYQAFSFLKNAVKDARQVFVLTHSFEFLRLLINWRKHGGGASYYMIKNSFNGNERVARICKMDKELIDFETEYQYLFKLLKQLRDAQDESIAKAYPIPNIARKVWETFLMFTVPSSATLYKKMDDLKADGADAQKLDAIYKFTNDQSHITGAGFDPALVPEAKKVTSELLEMMQAISPKHFKILDEATS